MARKTTKVARVAIEKHDSFRHQVEINIKRHGFYNSFEDIAKLTGMEIMLTEILNQQNCYHGFTVVDAMGKPTTEEEPQWRVSYIIKE